MPSNLRSCCCRRRQQLNEGASMTVRHFHASIECLFDSGLTIIDLLLERIAPSYSGILKCVKESNTNPSLVNVLCRATNSKSTRVELKLVKVLEEKTSLKKAEIRIGRYILKS